MRQLALLLGLSPEHLADERCADAFALRHGRPPMLGDEVPPWRYRGWLRLYVQALHAGCERQTGFPDRWGYLREIMEERRLPERPIPQVSFGLANRSVLKETDDWVGILDGKLGRWESFQKFVRFLAFGLAVSNDDPGLPDDASEALRWLTSRPGAPTHRLLLGHSAGAHLLLHALLRRSAPLSTQRWSDPLYLSERLAFVGVLGGHFASHVSIERLRQLNPWMRRSFRSFSILQPVAELVEALNSYAPTVIATYPTVAVLLADEARRGALRFRPRELWTGGETLGPAVRRRIEQALGCTVRNSYGASEFLTMGWECGHGRMHLNADWVMLEPIDDHGSAVSPGQPSCSTLLTHLANTVQPLIRYDLGDQVTVVDAPCACGSSMPVIQVQGRRDDPVVMAGPGGRSVTLLPMALTTVIEEQAGVYDFQLRQVDARTLALRLPGDDEAASHPSRALPSRRCRRAVSAPRALWARASRARCRAADRAGAAAATKPGAGGSRGG